MPGYTFVMPVLPVESAAVVARKRTLTFGSLRKAKEATGIATGTWQRVEEPANVERPTLYKVAEALWGDAAKAEDLLAGIDPDKGVDDYDYATYVAETPDHVQRTIDDLLMQHSASFRRTRGGS